jgi:cytochrome c oxidase subunit III
LADPLELAVREQFNNPVQQRETATVGMWVFLITEIMLFGALFTGFAVYRLQNPVGFDQGSAQMDFTLGAINTAVLICSSFAMALAVNSAERGRRLRLALFLVLTIVLGLVFLGIKFDEYYLHYLDHKAPGISFYQSGPQAQSIEMFYVFYYVMTGLHAVHMFVGIGLLTTLVLRTGLGSFSAEYHTPVEITGLYWHFVDTVWVFLFAIFYIPGAHLR